MTAATSRRAVACKGWLWLDGARWVNGALCDPHDTEHADVFADGGEHSSYPRFGIFMRGEFFEQEDYCDSEPQEPLPDLDDPATLGCLLSLVREAWYDSDAYAAPHGERLCWRVDIDPDSWGEDHDHPEGKTEAEALVAALEAAP